MESRQAYISRIHTSYDNVLAKNNVDVIRGFAKFVNKNTLEVTFADGTTEQVTADHVLIATGDVQVFLQYKARNTVLILTAFLL